MDDLRKTQESFARKAQAQLTHEFRDLYHLVCREDWLREALQAVLRHTGSRTAGVEQTLCDRCHMETTEWGRPRGTGGTQSRRAG